MLYNSKKIKRKYIYKRSYKLNRNYIYKSGNKYKSTHKKPKIFQFLKKICFLFILLFIFFFIQEKKTYFKYY